MNVFLDVGAGKGSDFDGFKKHYDMSKNWKLYAFECNKQLVGDIKGRHSDVEVMNYAASNKDGKANLYFGPQYLNNSILQEKVSVSKNNFTEVNTIDLSNWIQNNFTTNDYIVLLLDIEGAEYDVLEKMINDGSIDMIDELYLEFHGKKLEGFDMKRENDLKESMISKFGDKIYIYRDHNHKIFLRLNAEGS